MKLLGVVPAVTFMGWWSDVLDGIVHGLHFYQKNYSSDVYPLLHVHDF